jgi:hypothetical protein
MGNNLDRFNPILRRGKVGPETADRTEEQCSDGSHRAFGQRFW